MQSGSVLKDIVPVYDHTESAKADDASLGDMPQWDLSDLYKGPEAAQLKSDLEKAGQLAKAFEHDYKGKLSQIAAAGGLLDVIQHYEAISDLTGRIGSFIYLYYVLDTKDPVRGKFFGDRSQALTDLSKPLLFFSLELNQIDEQVLDRALTADQGLARYKNWFHDLRKARPHQLEERVELLFHDKTATGRSAWNRLFDETVASLEFDVDGEKLALEQTLTCLSSKDGKRRAAAFHGLAQTLAQNSRLLTHITNVLAKDKHICDQWRSYEDVADSRHLANNVEADVVDALTQSVWDALPKLSHRYYALKAKWMGQDQLNVWDRNAPLPDDDDTLFSFNEATDIVLDAYGRFSPKLRDVAQPFFNSGWIDAPVSDGKAPGAFAHPTVPSVHPYLMLNYLGKSRDVMTLAHELGHGVHQRLAASQGPLLAATPLTLAETASVFGEMLTFQSLLNRAKDDKTRRVLLANKVEDMLNTVVRQICFYKFERLVHEARREGELITDQINQFWIDVSAQSLGPAVKLNDGYEQFWSYVPHFIHSPFYVYAYAFGDCLVNSLYAVFEQSDEGFVEKYLDLLAAGGSKHHSEMLAPFGLDAKDPAFWHKGLAMIERFINELE